MKNKNKTKEDEIYVIAYQNYDDIEVVQGSKRWIKQFLKSKDIQENEVYWIRGYIEKQPKF